MKIFHEIYNNYFRIVAEIISQPEITMKEIQRIINIYGFGETKLYIPDNLWGMLKLKSHGVYVPVTKNPPVNVMTDIQKQWLKAKVNSPEMKLFMKDDALNKLKEHLKDIKPLYKNENFCYIDRFSDGDDYSDDNYRENFYTVLDALKKHQLLNITFMSGDGMKITGVYVPVKIQYSPKNDRFRLFVFSVRNKELCNSGIINIGRIVSVENTNTMWQGDISINEYFRRCRCREPVTVVISNERNTMERFFMEFAPYEKQTEYTNEKCKIKIYYDYREETELLIRLLSFGATVEIISPESFRKQATDRINKQYELMIKSRQK